MALPADNEHRAEGPCHFGGIDLHWNYQKQRSPVSIYTGTIKNNDLWDRSTLELSKTHIHPLLGHILKNY